MNSLLRPSAKYVTLATSWSTGMRRLATLSILSPSALGSGQTSTTARVPGLSIDGEAGRRRTDDIAEGTLGLDTELMLLTGTLPWHAYRELAKQMRAM